MLFFAKGSVSGNFSQSIYVNLRTVVTFIEKRKNKIRDIFIFVKTIQYMMNTIKISLIVALICLPYSLFSQITIKETVKNRVIGEIKPAGMFLMSCEYNDSNKFYIFLFRNLRFTQITDIKSFIIDSSDFTVLYTSIISQIDKNEDKELEVKLNNRDKLYLDFKKSKISFRLWNGISFSVSQYFNKKQINKLFGKTE